MHRHVVHYTVFGMCRYISPLVRHKVASAGKIADAFEAALAQPVEDD